MAQHFGILGKGVKNQPDTQKENDEKKDHRNDFVLLQPSEPLVRHPGGSHAKLRLRHPFKIAVGKTLIILWRVVTVQVIRFRVHGSQLFFLPAAWQAGPPALRILACAKALAGKS